MLRLLVLMSMAAAACSMAFAASQDIVVDAVDANGAAVNEAVCDIVNRGGTWRIVTPAVAQIIPTGDWLQVKCAKGFELAGTSTTIDTNGLAPRRAAAPGFAREVGGAPQAARVRVVLRDMTGAPPKPAAQTQIAQAAALPAFVPKPQVRAEPLAPVAEPVVIAVKPADAPAKAAASPALVAGAAAPLTPLTPLTPPTPPASPVPTVAAISVVAALAPAREQTVVVATTARDFYDVKAVPFLGAEGRTAYANFLVYPLPRAFAISRAGGWGWGVRGADARRLALDNCERRGGPCEIYAADKLVVWAGSP